MLEKQYTLVYSFIIFPTEIMLHVEYVSGKTLITRILETNGSSPYVVIYVKYE